MAVVAISMCKDEADVAEAFVRHTCSQVDHLVVADNMSSDGTSEILLGLAADLPLTVLHDPIVAYTQSAKMTALAEHAFREGFDWVLPVDFDEVWLSQHGRIADVLGRVNAAYALATMYDHVPTDADDPAEPDPFRRLVWRQREPGDLPKVACRTHPRLVIHQGNHGADPPGMAAGGLLEIRHFPWRSDGQAVTKARNGAAAYAASDLPEGMGWHWREYGCILDEQGEQALLDRVHGDRHGSASESDPALVYDPVSISPV